MEILIVNHIAGDVSGENSRIKRVLVRGKERKSPEEGLTLATVSPSQWPRDFAVSSISAVAILCLDPKPDGVREKIDDSIWLLCLFYFPPLQSSQFLSSGGQTVGRGFGHASGRFLPKENAGSVAGTSSPELLTPRETSRVLPVSFASSRFPSSFWVKLLCGVSF